jgi:stearoyl-CoA desaturase (Delta-9 desaturase)
MIATELSRTHRYYLLATTIVPPLGVVGAIVLLWGDLVGWSDVVVLAVMYSLCGLGISIGFHRLFTHRSFKTTRPIKLALAIFGTMAAHGPPLAWVAHHRQHHTYADVEGDPHSPHLHAGEGPLAVLRGLWFAHAGWRFSPNVAAQPVRYVRDLLRDRDMVWVSRHFIGITVAGIALAGLLGFALSGTMAGALTAILWGGLVRMFLGHHVTYSVNSIGHYFGPRRFETGDESRNVAWLALPTFGDSWHNNHHAFPTSAAHGLRWWELDVSALVIRSLERLGLAWDVVRIPPSRQRSKLVDGHASEGFGAGAGVRT